MSVLSASLVRNITRRRKRAAIPRFITNTLLPYYSGEVDTIRDRIVAIIADDNDRFAINVGSDQTTDSSRHPPIRF